jgi:hypothetical protein
MLKAPEEEGDDPMEDNDMPKDHQEADEEEEAEEAEEELIQQMSSVLTISHRVSHRYRYTHSVSKMGDMGMSNCILAHCVPVLRYCGYSQVNYNKVCFTIFYFYCLPLSFRMCVCGSDCHIVT